MPAEKSIVIYGPPGTGKTRRLLGILESLRKDRGIPVEEIGFVAFTRAAANEAKHRLGITKSKTVRTLHSFAYEAGGVSPDRMVSGDKLVRFGEFVGLPVQGKSATGLDTVEIGDEYLEVHYYARARKLTIAAAHFEMRSMLDLGIAQMVSDAYSKWKSYYGWVDYDDLLINFAQNPDTFGVRYLIVDEGQDLSPIQWDAVNAMDVACLWVAGDDDQSIYEWSGADPHGMRAYHEPDASNVRVLEQSWRIPKSVHRIAEGVINRVEKRWAKTYLPRESEGAAEGYGDIGLVPPPRPKEPTLVLYRNHQFRRAVENWLMDSSVPFIATGGTWSPFEGRWATALRAVFDLKGAGETSTGRIASLGKCAPDLLARLKAGDKEWLRHDPHDLIPVPEPIASYLRRVDLNARPEVTISTIHAAKGAEADRVVLLTGQGERTWEDSGGDAEHRTFYVGVTRARERLDVVQGDNPYPIEIG